MKAQNGTLLKDVLIDYTDLQTAHRKSKADGSYRSSNVGTGMHTLRAAKAGYQTFTIAIDIADEGDTPLNITMIPG